MQMSQLLKKPLQHLFDLMLSNVYGIVPIDPLVQCTGSISM